MDVRSRLEAIATQDSPDRVAKFNLLIEELVVANDSNGLLHVVEAALGEGTPLIALQQQAMLSGGRQLLQLVCADKHLTRLAPDVLVTVCTQTLEWLRNRLVSFEDEDLQIRDHLGAAYLRAGHYGLAARTLAQGNLESSRRTPAARAEKYIQIAELYLQENDASSADTYCTRAAMLMHQVDSATLALRHKVCHGQILDRKRKFLEAASRYLEVSLEVPDNIEYLDCAVTCVILAPAGPQRSRLLALLCKDERIERCVHYAVLRKMFMERFIAGDEVVSLEASLMEHQKAQLVDGTVLQRALLEHNVLAACKIYKNMFLDDLGRYLGVPVVQAERISTKMISENRLDALVDQRAAAIHFHPRDVEASDQWNIHIQKICSHINDVLDEISVG
eukprot:GEMP01054553.1.p1 GENE.GEMP01054553.1~~GEMP01054553.1.p1  ORF type:complete len:391 (+),score=90.13 GEMP01054553.1:301-1473(+)